MARKIDKRRLANEAVNDAARKVTVVAGRVAVPMKFDEDGNPAELDRVSIKVLSINDLRFLKALRENDWDPIKAAGICGFDLAKVERRMKKLACFRVEDAKVKALAEIPSPQWIAARHVENVYSGGPLQESEHKSLQELAKISGAYKNTNQINIQQNFLQMPAMSEEARKQLEELADKLADMPDDVSPIDTEAA